MAGSMKKEYACDISHERSSDCTFSLEISGKRASENKD
jgi:hypothetical protein